MATQVPMFFQVVCGNSSGLTKLFTLRRAHTQLPLMSSILKGNTSEESSKRLQMALEAEFISR